MSYNPGLPSEYERNALKEIQAWKHPEQSFFGQIADIASWPIDKVGELVMSAPGVDYVMERAVSGIVSHINDFACWTVRSDAVYEEYEQRGMALKERPSDLFKYDLEKLDAVVGFLGAKYKTVAAGEGALTGAAGFAGIPADVLSLLTLSQRAVGEYATYYGFDVSLQNERIYALNVLGYSSSATDAAKQAAMAQLAKIARDVAAKKTWKHLEQYAFVQMIKKICESVGIRITKAKLADIIPGVGAVIGGGFNAYFMSKVCDAAFFLYRERFLAQKYGESIIRV